MDNQTTIESQCNQQLQHYSYTTFIINAIVTATLCIFGIVGNIQVVVWLTRLSRHLRLSNFRIYLTTLCITDSLTLLSACFTLVIPAWTNYMEMNNSIKTSWISSLLIVTFYPMGHISYTISTWLVVTMTIVRFMNIQMTTEINSTTFTRLIVGIIVSGGIAINVTRMMELRLTTCIHSDYNTTIYTVGATPLRLNNNYVSYYLVILYNGLIFIIPTVALFILNTIIIYSLNKHTVICSGIKQSSQSEIEHQQSNDGDEEELDQFESESNQNSLKIRKTKSLEKETKKVTGLVLGAMSVIFLVCNLLPSILNVAERTQPELFGTLESSQAQDTITDISNLMVCLHSSLNFVLFMVFSKYFRRSIRTRLRTAREHLQFPQWTFHLRPTFHQPPIVTSYARWQRQPHCRSIVSIHITSPPPPHPSVTVERSPMQSMWNDYIQPPPNTRNLLSPDTSNITEAHVHCNTDTNDDYLRLTCCNNSAQGTAHLLHQGDIASNNTTAAALTSQSWV